MYLLNACSEGTRFNLMAAKLRCSIGTLSLIAKNEKIPPQLHVQIHLKVVYYSSLHLLHQRYDFVSEVGKIVKKKKSFFINERNWSSG